MNQALYRLLVALKPCLCFKLKYHSVRAVLQQASNSITLRTSYFLVLFMHFDFAFRINKLVPHLNHFLCHRHTKCNHAHHLLFSISLFVNKKTLFNWNFAWPLSCDKMLYSDSIIDSLFIQLLLSNSNFVSLVWFKFFICYLVYLLVRLNFF